MIPLDEAHALLNEWYENGCVGNLVFFHAPQRGCVDAIEERVIKAREMSDDERKALSKAYATMKATKIELRGSDGELDLAKVSRSVRNG